MQTTQRHVAMGLVIAVVALAAIAAVGLNRSSPQEAQAAAAPEAVPTTLQSVAAAPAAAGAAALPCGLDLDLLSSPGVALTSPTQTVGRQDLTLLGFDATDDAAAVELRKLVFATCVQAGATITAEGTATLTWFTECTDGALIRDGDRSLLVAVSRPDCSES